MTFYRILKRRGENFRLRMLIFNPSSLHYTDEVDRQTTIRCGESIQRIVPIESRDKEILGNRRRGYCSSRIIKASLHLEHEQSRVILRFPARRPVRSCM